MGFDPKYGDPDNTLLFKIASLLDSQVTGDVSSFNGRTGAVVLMAADVTPLLAGETIPGNFFVSGFIEAGYIFSHFMDATTNVAPASMEVYHETSGTPAVGFGTSLDLTMDDAMVKRQVGTRFLSSWTVATDATRTARLRIFMPNAGAFVQAFECSPTLFGAYGVAAVARPLVPTGSSIDAVITALQSLGLFRQT